MTFQQYWEQDTINDKNDECKHQTDFPRIDRPLVCQRPSINTHGEVRKTFGIKQAPKINTYDEVYIDNKNDDFDHQIDFPPISRPLVSFFTV